MALALGEGQVKYSLHAIASTPLAAAQCDFPVAEGHLEQCVSVSRPSVRGVWKSGRSLPSTCE